MTVGEEDDMSRQVARRGNSEFGMGVNGSEVPARGAETVAGFSWLPEGPLRMAAEDARQEFFSWRQQAFKDSAAEIERVRTVVLGTMRTNDFLDRPPTLEVVRKAKKELADSKAAKDVMEANIDSKVQNIDEAKAALTLALEGVRPARSGTGVSAEAPAVAEARQAIDEAERLVGEARAELVAWGGTSVGDGEDQAAVIEAAEAWKELKAQMKRIRDDVSEEAESTKAKMESRFGRSAGKGRQLEAVDEAGDQEEVSGRPGGTKRQRMDAEQAARDLIAKCDRKKAAEVAEAARTKGGDAGDGGSGGGGQSGGTNPGTATPVSPFILCHEMGIYTSEGRYTAGSGPSCDVSAALFGIVDADEVNEPEDESSRGLRLNPTELKRIERSRAFLRTTPNSMFNTLTHMRDITRNMVRSALTEERRKWVFGPNALEAAVERQAAEWHCMWTARTTEIESQRTYYKELIKLTSWTEVQQVLQEKRSLVKESEMLPWAELKTVPSGLGRELERKYYSSTASNSAEIARQAAEMTALGKRMDQTAGLVQQIKLGGQQQQNLQRPQQQQRGLPAPWPPTGAAGASNFLPPPPVGQLLLGAGGAQGDGGSETIPRSKMAWARHTAREQMGWPDAHKGAGQCHYCGGGHTVATCAKLDAGARQQYDSIVWRMERDMGNNKG